MIFKRLSISIDSRDFWTANDPNVQERFVRAIERGVNHPKHIKMAEHLIPDDLQDMLENVPIMLISMVVDDAVHQFADFSYHLRDSDYEIGAMFACHTDPDLCGIVIPVERLHDPFHLRHSIVHELVHYEQWKRGDLQTSPEHDGLLWKGKLYTNEYMTESHGMSFADGMRWQIENLPWEEEAYGSCDQMVNAGRDERDLYYWLCDRYRQEPEDYDKYWSKKDNVKNYLSALMDLDGGNGLMSKKRKLEDQQTAIRKGALTLAEVDRMAYDAAGFSSPSYDASLLAGEMAPHPVQPVYEDENGTVRFKPNPIIRDLQEAGVLDLNKIAAKYDKKDISQLNQLIGYSVDGWWYLSTTSQMDKIKASMQEERRKAFDSIDGEINYLRKKDDITPIDAIHVTTDVSLYELPIELPILFQRITVFDGHYSLSVYSKESWEVEWVDSSFHGHCSYNLTPDSPDGAPEFPVGTINLKVNEDHLWLEKIGEPESGQAILTFNWSEVSEQLSRSKCELPTIVNFGISKLLTNYGTFTKTSTDFQGIYQMCQAVLRFMASRKFILDNLTPETFESELYDKLLKAASYGPVKGDTSVTKLLKAKQRSGIRGQIQTAFKHIANSEILFEDSKIHLETDRAVYDAHTVELETLIKQYL